MTSYPDIPRLTSSMPAPSGIGLAGFKRVLLDVGALSRDFDTQNIEQFAPYIFPLKKEALRRVR